MKNGTVTGSKFLIAAIAALALTTSSTFAQHLIGFSPKSGDNIMPVPAPPGGGGDNIDAPISWANTGTDFNTGSSWVGGTAPGAGDVALFTAAEATNPNLSSSVSIAGFYFNGTGVNGYDVTAN